MDFLNKSFAQLKDLFLSMTPGARITSALLLAVVIVSLAYLFTHEIAGPDVCLLGGEMFSTAELNKMQAAFGQEGLEPCEIEGNKIRVPRGRQSDYMAALTKHNALPDDFGDIFTRALDSGSGFMSPREREERLKIARQQELSRIISSIKEIEKAYVLYDTKRERAFGRDAVTTASVVVEPRDGEELPPELGSSIRLLVVKSIAGLEPKDVAVTNRITGYTTLGNAAEYGAPHNDEYISRKNYHEQQYREKILQTLGHIPGVVVATDVELDTEKSHQEEEVKHDPKPVALQSNESSVTETVESSPPSGPPGYSAQQNTSRRLASATSTGSKEEREETETNQVNALSSQVVKSERAGLTPKRVTVAVTVPTRYYEDLWRGQNPPQAGEESKEPTPNDLDPIRQAEVTKIKETVAALLPEPEDGSDPKNLVTVTDFQKITPPPIPEPSLAENALAWFGQYWSTLGILGLVAFSLVMLRSMIQAAPAAETAGRVPSPRSAEAGEGDSQSEEGPAPRKLKRFGSSGASLRDELSDLVNEDPDSAANILRNWIGNVT